MKRNGSLSHIFLSVATRGFHAIERYRLTAPKASQRAIGPMKHGKSNDRLRSRVLSHGMLAKTTFKCFKSDMSELLEPQSLGTRPRQRLRKCLRQHHAVLMVTKGFAVPQCRAEGPGPDPAGRRRRWRGSYGFQPPICRGSRPDALAEKPAEQRGRRRARVCSHLRRRHCCGVVRPGRAQGEVDWAGCGGGRAAAAHAAGASTGCIVMYAADQRGCGGAACCMSSCDKYLT